MESQLPYSRMENENPDSTNTANNVAAQPTVVIIAAPQEDYSKTYNGKVALLSGIVVLVCGILTVGLNVSKFL